MHLSDISGIGLKTIKYLNNLGIYTIDDLVSYYPYRYEIIKRSDLNSINIGDKVIIDGVVEVLPNISYYGKRKNSMSFRINAVSRILSITIYNRGFLKNKIKVGMSIIVKGKYVSYNKIIATDISFGVLSNESKVEVIYRKSSNITSKELNNYINSALINYVAKEYIPKYLMDKYNFMSKIDALREIHNPTSSSRLKKSINMLKYEELFIFMVKINRLKISRNKSIGIKREVDSSLVYNFINKLPFKLTSDQVCCVKEIYNDLTSHNRMNRLIEGDVGSGKTIVAFIALYINYLSNYQGVLMAPTEVLAYQHYENIKKYMGNINIEILTGSIKSKDRQLMLNRLKSKNIDIIIGTHSLFSEDVIYNNLGLVITDEQHRFGVRERASLRNKGVSPDILYLSATPIPRTYALTIYGDMDISLINTVPNGKKEIITIIKKNSEIKDVLNMMLKELKSKHQIYVIAPLAEESDTNLMSVLDLCDNMNKAFGKIAKIGNMYGKMNTTDKDLVMSKFKNKEIDILVSTTVIEVGVDVANATMIVIFDAERFGLSTLHQLRGRVGRNNLQSYCILISNKDTERLKIMEKTSNGFEISEEDFRLRGSGDLFGIRQSGDMQFKLANIKRDYNLLLKAKEDSLEYINNMQTK